MLHKAIQIRNVVNVYTKLFLYKQKPLNVEVFMVLEPQSTTHVDIKI